MSIADPFDSSGGGTLSDPFTSPGEGGMSSGAVARDSAATEDAPTLFRAALEVLDRPNAPVPALTVMLDEKRSGGWTGTARVNPRVASPETALHTLLQDGLVPGSAILVKLAMSAGSRHDGTTVRTWPAIVTSVSTRPWDSPTATASPEAFCALTFRDPVSYLGSRPIWSSFARCSLGEMVGGVLSAAAGGTGRPTREPRMPGMPLVRIRERLREEIHTVPYAIAAGEPLGSWLSQVCGRLGARIEMYGDAGGRLIVELCDGDPSANSVNRDGGVFMTVDPRRAASAVNLTISEPVVGSPLPPRGALLDTPAGGGARRFGRAGAVESVITAAYTGLTEAAKRVEFRRTGADLSRVRISASSCQPGLLPGRVIKVASSPHGAPDPQSSSSPDSSGTNGYASLFGLKEWQVVDISHLYTAGRYWNRSDLEKSGAGWCPAVPIEPGVKVASAIVDDGETTAGEQIRRDRLGRIPVRFPFAFETPDQESTAHTDDASTSDGETPTSTGVTRWPPSIRLAPMKPVAGNLHGFVSAHRQGDLCRVAVVNPLYAEIVGFGYRDDRYLNAGIRDATAGMVVRQGAEEWRGMLFRPGKDMEREYEDLTWSWRIKTAMDRVTGTPASESGPEDDDA